MPLVAIPEPFDHPDWLFELKHDGFRALAHIEGHRCELISRGGHVFRKWDVLGVEISHSVRCMSAILDGEIVSLDPDGRKNFQKLLFRRDWPYFCAFDLVSWMANIFGMAADQTQAAAALNHAAHPVAVADR